VRPVKNILGILMVDPVHCPDSTTELNQIEIF